MVTKCVEIHSHGGKMEDIIEDFIHYLDSVKHTKTNTIQSYRRDLTRLVDTLKKEDIESWSDVTEDRLSAYVAEMTEQFMADTTIARHISSIRSFFHYLVESGEIERDISESLKAPKIERKLPQILTQKEIDSLLLCPDHTTPKGKRDRAMLELMYATGIRVSEIVELKIDDVDFRVNCLDFHKKGEDRLVPFGIHARTAIMDYLMGGRLDLLAGNEDDGTLFLSATDGKSMSRQGVWKLLKKYGRLAGIKFEITPFTIRHTFTAHLLENGADLNVVQEMLGHTDIASTAWYAENKHNYLREIYERTRPRS